MVSPIAGIEINACPVANGDQKLYWASRIRISFAQDGDQYFPFIAGLI
jgi:hypothetical protein